MVWGKLAGGLIGAFASKKSQKNAGNAYAAMSPFSPLQKMGMAANMYNRAVEDPTLSAKRDMEIARQSAQPRLRDMTEQFGANVGQRMGTGGMTGQSGFANNLGGRIMEREFRQGGLQDLSAMQNAYARQMQALQGGLGLQAGYDQGPGMAAINAQHASRMAIPSALGVAGSLLDQRFSGSKDRQREAEAYKMFVGARGNTPTGYNPKYHSGMGGYNPRFGR